MEIQKSVLLDLTKDILLKDVKQLQARRNLSNSDIETVIYRVLAEIKESKEKDYANIILDMAYQLDEKDKQLAELQKPTEKEG